MSSEIRIVEEHGIPYSIARKYLESLIKDGISSSLIQRTYDYLTSVIKCDADNAQKLMEELKQFNLKEETIAIIASICPDNIDDLRAVLVIEGSINLDKDQLEKIVEIVKKYKSG